MTGARTDYAVLVLELATEFNLTSEAVLRLEAEFHAAHRNGRMGDPCGCSACAGIRAATNPEDAWSDVTVRRLADGEAALALPLPAASDLSAWKQYRELVRTGTVSLQSLDDLGSKEHNQKAWDDMRELEKRLDNANKVVARLSATKVRGKPSPIRWVKDAKDHWTARVPRSDLVLTAWTVLGASFNWEIFDFRFNPDEPIWSGKDLPDLSAALSFAEDRYRILKFVREVSAEFPEDDDDARLHRIMLRGQAAFALEAVKEALAIEERLRAAPSDA
jgi:hypothetical protein